MKTTISLHYQQHRFRRSSAIYRGFVGGRGAGKSFVGAYDLIRRARPGRLYMVAAPTYPMLRDSSLRAFETFARSINYLREFSRGDMRAVLGNGAEVLFRSADEPERLRGPNLSGAWMDEASIMHRDAYDIIIACLREAGEQGWLSATFTPKGRAHWTFEVFGDPDRANVELFHARTRDNPFLPQSFADTLAGQYTSAFAAQEIGGEFVDLRGNIAQRQWFHVINAAPHEAQHRVRAWDFAASERTSADFTVGTLMSVSGGIYTIEHVVREKTGPAGVEELLRQTAASDGPHVPIVLEQEGGSSGKMMAASMVRMLAGYNVRAVRPSADKVTRAMPMFAQAQAGNVRLVSGSWVKAWLDEISIFPNGEHDDQVDSASSAFSNLAKPMPTMPQPLGGRMRASIMTRGSREVIA